MKNTGLKNYTQEIIKYYQDGKTLREIAKIYNVSHNAIRELLIKNNIKMRNVSRQYKNKMYVMYKIDNYLTAYWYGFLICDSYINRNMLVLALKKTDIEHLKKFLSFLNYQTEIKNIKNLISVNIPVTGEYEILKNNGLCYLKRNRFIPVMDKNLVGYFVRGMFDADGGIYNNEYIISFSGKFEFIKFFIEYLNIPALRKKHSKLFNNYAGICWKYNNNSYCYKLSGIVAYQALQKIYFDDKIYLDRKFKLYQRYKKEFK